jgi:hypothetical protein
VAGLIVGVLGADPSAAQQRSRRAADPVETSCRERGWTAVPVPDETNTDPERQAIVARWWLEYMQCLQPN